MRGHERRKRDNMTNAESLSYLHSDIEEWTADLATAKAEKDTRGAKELKVMIKDAKAEIALIEGAAPETVTWGSPVKDGIHSGDRAFTFNL